MIKNKNILSEGQALLYFREIFAVVFFLSLLIHYHKTYTQVFLKNGNLTKQSGIVSPSRNRAIGNNCNEKLDEYKSLK